MPSQVSKSPNVSYSLNIGISAICSGTTRRPMTPMKNQSRPGKSSHANAYPAIAPRTTTRSVLPTAMYAVVFNAVTRPAFLKSA